MTEPWLVQQILPTPIAQRGLCPVIDAKLHVDRGQNVSDTLFLDADVISNLLIAPSEGDALQNCSFRWG